MIHKCKSMATIILREWIPVDPDNILGSYKTKQLVFARNVTLFTTLLLEIDRYISLPIFCRYLSILHFLHLSYTIIPAVKCVLCIWHIQVHTHLEQWTHTHTHTHTWSSGQCSLRRSSSTNTACNFIQDSLSLWNTLHYINIYYRTIISPINI